MLKKNDLAKQFELVVQQEIKNYNDSLNFILQSLRDMKESLDEVRNDSLENYALIHSENVSLRSFVGVVSSRQDDDQKILFSYISDNESFKNKLKDEILIHTSMITKNLDDLLTVDNDCEDLFTKIERCEHTLAMQRINFFDALEIIRFNVSKDMARLKEEILEVPSDSEAIRKDLDEKLSTYKVDSDGLLKEIAILKKENLVNTKHIEHLYTLIERLSEG